jgi:hypothetical protein
MHTPNSNRKKRCMRAALYKAAAALGRARGMKLLSWLVAPHACRLTVWRKRFLPAMKSAATALSARQPSAVAFCAGSWHVTAMRYAPAGIMLDLPKLCSSTEPGMAA